jgi:16S rRNA (uracil1498-N3)-methyltransferase
MLNVNVMGSDNRIFSTTKIVLDSEIPIDDDRARYVSRTLRLKVGDRFIMFDGSGGEYQVLINRISKGEVAVTAESYEDRNVESPLPIHLLQGVSRGDRMDAVVQKATELGVIRISPVLTEFSIVRLDAERASKRALHWTRIAQSACEQCGRNDVPQVDAPTTLADWLGRPERLPEQRVVMLPGAKTNIAAIPLAVRESALMIGPEGGFSPAEIEQAAAAGFQSVSMGPRILRTETAAIAAIAILQSRLGDL